MVRNKTKHLHFDSDGTIHKKFILQYDSDGNLIKKLEYDPRENYFTTSKKDLVNREVFKYDSDGNKVEGLYYLNNDKSFHH